MLEVQQENNGNAIIVFTIVTIIFLPLSWATSYLGMNTTDIRDLEKGQWLFWAIALPVTSIVIGLAVVVVLKGESIREFFISYQEARDRKQISTASMPKDKTMSYRMTGTSFMRENSTMKLGNNPAWQGFRRRPSSFNKEGEV